MKAYNETIASMHIQKYSQMYEVMLQAEVLTRLSDIETSTRLVLALELAHTCNVLYALTGGPKWDMVAQQWDVKAATLLAEWRNLNT